MEPIVSGDPVVTESVPDRAQLECRYEKQGQTVEAEDDGEFEKGTGTLKRPGHTEDVAPQNGLALGSRAAPQTFKLFDRQGE